MSFSPLRGAIIVSLLLHFGFVGWVSKQIRARPVADLSSLHPVSVSPVLKPLPPAPKAKQPPPPPVKRPVLPATPPRRERNSVKRTTTHSRAPKSATRRAVAARPKAAPIHPSPPRRMASRLPDSAMGRPSMHGAKAAPPKRNSPKAGASGQSGQKDADEDVPDGPVDMEAVHSEKDGSDAVESTAITKGTLVAPNIKVKGQIRAGLVHYKAFSGPGVIAVIKGLKIPLSAPPGTVYRLNVIGEISDKQFKTIPFTPVSGSVTVVPSKAPLPPVDQPSLSGRVLGVGNLYAHRGDSVRVEVFAGEGIKEILGVDVTVKYSDVKVPPRKKKSSSLSSAVKAPPSEKPALPVTKPAPAPPSGSSPAPKFPVLPTEPPASPPSEAKPAPDSPPDPKTEAPDKNPPPPAPS